MPDGRVRCDFNQITGPKDKPIAQSPILESRDGGATWNRVTREVPAQPALGSGGGIYQGTTDSCRGMAVLPDGTLVRKGWAPALDLSEKATGYVVRSTDGGKTWSEKIFFLPPEEYRTWPTLIRPLRDGRLILFAGCWKRGDHQCGSGMNANIAKMMFVSSDKGQTWGKPILLMPINEGACEESDFCELPNGDLFWVHRVEHSPKDRTGYSDRMQSIARKVGDTFVPGKCEVAPFPHSGFPAVLYTKEGLILHLATDGVYWTADTGKTWKRLDIPGTPYYPEAMQLKDGTILCVGHNGSDDQYGTVDQSIVQQTFRLKVRGQ